jgi:hypothetical protein
MCAQLFNNSDVMPILRGFVTAGLAIGGYVIAPEAKAAGYAAARASAQGKPRR